MSERVAGSWMLLAPGLVKLGHGVRVYIAALGRGVALGEALYPCIVPRNANDEIKKMLDCWIGLWLKGELI